MIFENNYIHFNPKLNINSISSYKNIMTRFVNNYVKLYSYNYKNKSELFSDAITYSKYYLYYKINNCEYSDDVMEIIYNIDFSINK